MSINTLDKDRIYDYDSYLEELRKYRGGTIEFAKRIHRRFRFSYALAIGTFLTVAFLLIRLI